MTAVEDKLELHALSGIEVKDTRIVDKIKAYNMVIKERGAHRSQQASDEKIVHLGSDIGHRTGVCIRSPTPIVSSSTRARCQWV